jgi:hypothetical protein
MPDHYEHDARDYDPDKVRPRDLDEALMTPNEQRLDRAATNIENAGKVWKPIWAILAAIVCGAVWFGKFYADYQYNAENGSPAVRTLIAGQQRQIDNQQTQIDKLTIIVQFLTRRQTRDDSWSGLDDAKPKQ